MKMAPDEKHIPGQASAKWSCGHCGEEATLGCGQCKNVRYCTQECQRADWPFHKTICKHYVQTFAKERPSAEARLAILIEEGEVEPAFVWIPVKTEATADAQVQDDDSDLLAGLAEDLGVSITERRSSTVLPAEDTFIAQAMKSKSASMLVCGKQGNGELLDYSIHVACRPASSARAAPNKFLLDLFGEKTASCYRGDTYLFAMTKVYTPSTMVDIDTRGFTLALDALDVRANLRPAPRKKAIGVRVSVSKPHYEEVRLPVRHPVFIKGDVSQVASLFGERLLVHKFPAAAKGKPVPSSSPERPANPGAWLYLETKLTSPAFGSLSKEAKTDPRDIIVASTNLEEDGNKGSISAILLRSIVGMLRCDVQAMLSKKSKHPLERVSAVINLRQYLNQGLVQPWQKGLREEGRKQGFIKDDSDSESSEDEQDPTADENGGVSGKEGEEAAAAEQKDGEQGHPEFEVGEGKEAAAADQKKDGEQRHPESGADESEEESDDDSVRCRVRYAMNKTFMRF